MRSPSKVKRRRVAPKPAPMCGMGLSDESLNLLHTYCPSGVWCPSHTREIVPSAGKASPGGAPSHETTTTSDYSTRRAPQRSRIESAYKYACPGAQCCDGPPIRFYGVKDPTGRVLLCCPQVSPTPHNGKREVAQSWESEPKWSKMIIVIMRVEQW